MDRREKLMTPHQPPLLSSLVVRPSESAADADAAAAASGGGGNRTEYELGEVRHDPQPPPPHSYSRPSRYSDDNHGYRTREFSGSPAHRREVPRRYSPDIENPGDLRHHGFPSGRDALRPPIRFRESSPPHYQRGGGRPLGRAFEIRGLGPGPLRGEVVQRNNPNVRPRDGDWYCRDPRCGNLNFARREHCNNCGRHRYAPVGSPRRGRVGPPPPFGGPRRFPPPPVERSPGRFANGYRSPPPRSWLRDEPRDFAPSGMPPPRHEGRFPDHYARRDRLDYPEEGFRDAGKFERLAPPEFHHRGRARDNFVDDRKGYERRPPSPPLSPPSHRGRWVGRDFRERSRSPIGAGPPKDFHRDPYAERDRDDRRGGGRGRVSRVF